MRRCVSIVHGLCSTCIVVLVTHSFIPLLLYNFKNCCSVCEGWGAAEECYLPGVNDRILTKTLTTKAALSHSHYRVRKYVSLCVAMTIMVVRNEYAQSRCRPKISLTLEWPIFCIASNGMSSRTFKINIILRIDLFFSITFQRGRSKVGRTKPRGRKSPSPLHHHDTDIDTRRNN